MIFFRFGLVHYLTHPDIHHEHRTEILDILQNNHYCFERNLILNFLMEEGYFLMMYGVKDVFQIDFAHIQSYKIMQDLYMKMKKIDK